ncbi:MAG: NAD(+)/NADH kinase [Clostridia bacterium]|nr:NAD(+)/NADH kinase [Clostridia bacterium]
MRIQTHTVCLYPNTRKTLPAEPLRAVTDKLRTLGWTVCVTDKAYESDGLPFCAPETAFAKNDLAVVLGGDGTMLRAAHLACAHPNGQGEPIPLLGINFGNVGYMTELETGELQLLDGLSEAPVENRMLLDVSVKDVSGAVTGPFLALNETVICREQAGKILKLKLYCDGHEVSSYRADGMILSTPTGSSAYNLSAGGPIIDPKLNALVLCPLAAFTLSSVHPMVFSPESVLEIAAEGSAAVTCDGKVVSTLPEGGRLTVSRSPSCLRLVKLKNANFYEVLLRKLS